MQRSELIHPHESHQENQQTVNTVLVNILNRNLSHNDVV